MGSELRAAGGRGSEVSEWPLQSTDIAELNAQIGNERMKLDAKALEYKNAALNLRNTQLELELISCLMKTEYFIAVISEI